MPIIYSLLKALQRPKVFSFLHIPVQSGNDTILQRMNRRYTVSNFLDVVERFRRNVDGISIATDIICGFPGETEGQYEESLSLVQNLAPDVLNISRFWPRPGTEAERLEGHLPGGVTKDRSRRMAELWNKVSEVLNRRWVGWEGEILLDERGYNETTVGRNQSYKAVAIKGNYWLGDFVKVRITESARGYLIGEKI
jgi:tRNA A37 methylthiotransferase MiaB